MNENNNEQTQVSPGVIVVEEFNLKQNLLRYLIIGISCIVIISVIILGIILSRSSNEDLNYVLYYRDKGMYQVDLNQGKPREITDRLSESSSDNDGYSMENCVITRGNGQKIFYPDKIQTGLLFTLYYKDLKSDEEAIKIDSDVVYYTVDTKGENLVYVKQYPECNLYRSSIDDKEKIDSDIENLYTSDDLSKIIYRKFDGTIYYIDENNNKEKIDSNSYIEKVSDDLSEIYYVKDDILYKRDIDGDKIKIDTNVSQTINIYDTGEIYYYKVDVKETFLIDYLNDNFASDDMSIEYPVSPNEPYYAYYETADEYLAAWDLYDIELALYIENYVKYQDMLFRAHLMEQIEEEIITEYNYSLWYYDNEKTVQIDESINPYDIDGYVLDFQHGKENQVVLYSQLTKDAAPFLTWSEFDYDIDLFINLVESSLSGERTQAVAIKDTTFSISEETLSYYILNERGDKIYYLDDIDDENNSGDLYEITITNNVLNSAKLHDQDTSYGRFIDDDNYLYFKEFDNNGKSSMYLNKNKISDDVSLSPIKYSENNKLLYYYIDYDSDSSTGTLKSYNLNTNENIKIKDDVGSFSCVDDKVLYLGDYNNEYRKGELWVYSNNENVKLDDDVSHILTTNNLDTKKYASFS